MAAPSSVGSPAGEPTAALEGLRIERERLVLDLTPIPEGRYAAVEAEYRIVNAGPARTLPLEFVALGRALEGAQVWLDDQPVSAERVDSLAVPAAWAVVKQTPALEGAPLPYAVSDGFHAPSGIRFTVTVPTGQHTIRVRYDVEVGFTSSGDHPNLVHQFAYSLAPARTWAGFGQLDLEVRLPAGWDAATTLPLRREGDTLTGRFRGVPGDVLAVSARAPISPLRRPLQVLGVLAWALIVAFFGIVSGRLAARSGRRARAALPGAILGGLIAAVVFVIVQLLAVDTGDSGPTGYGLALSLMLIGTPVAFVVGAVLAQGAAVWSHRRRRPA